MYNYIFNNTLFNLFITFFRVGAFTFGGGYAMLPLIKKDIVEKQNWLDEKDFLDALTIAQSVPGAIAINTAIYSGFKIRGIWGALVSLLGIIIPSFVIILLIAMFLLQWQDIEIIEKSFMGIRPGVVGLIFAAVINIGKPILANKKSFLFFFAAFLLAVLGLHPFMVIIIFGTLAIILHYKDNKHKKDNMYDSYNTHDNDKV